jgi:NAD(P) transhydrogenase beta subunit
VIHNIANGCTRPPDWPADNCDKTAADSRRTTFRGRVSSSDDQYRQHHATHWQYFYAAPRYRLPWGSYRYCCIFSHLESRANPIDSVLGGVTFTGSVVAALKLAGRMSSKPLILPGRHLINTSLLGANVATMGAFITMAPGAPMVAAACLAGNTVLSFLKGFTTTAAIGGADMREHHFPSIDLR